ncbi:NdvB protein [Pseudocolwellia sp. AS88]|uniref:GH36-type glycosyl hydrolase domain-containing protein n=1 Tax=Pseudocolwellia sp. AS88 TaxID=3063958 RepID=UPI0026F02E0B|nr:NdvB protein [Pseudocolwellia sp. AS88]MDO7086301.1 NdvB protein [Pseudocolwellia sp. AS88]
MSESKTYSFADDGQTITLHSPTKLPNASGFLWNSQMMINMNCRGYAIAQFMQPEPAKYSYAPNMEAKTFMQPEHAYFSHHPGRFFYIKDEDTGEIFSAPYEPLRTQLDRFDFVLNKHNINWVVEKLGIEIQLSLSLTVDKPIELWNVTIRNLTDETRNISVYPYFSIGYMSWLNQSAVFDQYLNAVVATCVTPYQKVEDYPKQKEFKDKTFLLADREPVSWTSNQKTFEGEGGLHNPSALTHEYLDKADAIYETPVAVLQYQMSLAGKANESIKLVFGAAKTNDEIAVIKKDLFTVSDTSNKTFDKELVQYQAYVNSGKSNITIESPDVEFNHFINHWLPRQVFYHGDVNRLSTDPQTRNYLQDNMGMSYINSALTKESFLTSLSQQLSSGVMPDGVLLHPDAELKYINQVPHADHSVWLPICLSVYLSETNDALLLNQELAFADSQQTKSVKQHIDLAMEALIAARDHRGLSFIEQGDWCDPMNMVGYKGKGVSAWLSLATAYALNTWADLCETYADELDKITYFRKTAEEINEAVNLNLWDGQWYGRGITDDNVVFGIKEDIEGRIYLNPQSWSILSGAADKAKTISMMNEVEQQLSTPFGDMMLAPSYTKMRDDVGRLTQKHPGVSENGAVYNHAAIFYAYSLYSINKGDEAFNILKKMLPTLDDVEKRGQLPNYIPNYYRGAYKQFPEQAGRSSQLFNTGTVAWFQRCIVEGLCGLKGVKGELIVDPQLPSHWNEMTVSRSYLGATFNVEIFRNDITEKLIMLNENILIGNKISNIEHGKTYNITVILPLGN